MSKLVHISTLPPAAFPRKQAERVPMTLGSLQVYRENKEKVTLVNAGQDTYGLFWQLKALGCY
jgi:hypothetical protein